MSVNERTFQYKKVLFGTKQTVTVTDVLCTLIIDVQRRASHPSTEHGIMQLAWHQKGEQMPLPLSPLPFSRHIMTSNFSISQRLKSPRSSFKESQCSKKPALTWATCNGRSGAAVVTTYAHAAAVRAPQVSPRTVSTEGGRERVAVESAN